MDYLFALISALILLLIKLFSKLCIKIEKIGGANYNRGVD